VIIRSAELPPHFDLIFGRIWDQATQRFNVQETYILDFKETIPSEFSDSYGVGIVRLALAFHNSYGGLIIFGVQDRSLVVVGTNNVFNIEKFNRLLTDVANVHVECLAKNYSILVEGTLRTITAVLVPKRGIAPPAKLTRDFGGYPIGTLWVRDRHEVLEATLKHLPVLYSERQDPSESPAEDNAKFPVHRSFPPSPATLKDFVNRDVLMETLWNWFVLGDRPRFYLHGPGGSGKSTLAFEFARLLAEYGHGVRTKNGDKVDYVVYISGKETEVNPLTGRQQAFELRQFGSATEQFAQILFHSGYLDKAELESVSEPRIDELLDELFANFAGLIVIDDIDALSRRDVDTGEESLFLKAAQSPKRTRILYTLRFRPDHAFKSEKEVTGLNDAEFSAFIKVCGKQFNVEKPDERYWVDLKKSTNSLPLLIETIVALRRSSSNYDDAINSFNSKGGDEARHYLYRREYDRLQQQGRSRNLLAGLYLVAESISTSTMSGLFKFSPQQLSDAIGECGTIFLSTSEDDAGETLYQLVAPCVPFIGQVSKDLTFFNVLQARVEHFKTQGAKLSFGEAALIFAMERSIRQGNYSGVIRSAEQVAANHLALQNPKVKALLGQAYKELGKDYREKARECFNDAESLGYLDIFMMRRWFHMEFLSGYGMTEAERICNVVITSRKFAPRFKSEFWSKLGSCLFKRAVSVLNVNREKCLNFLRKSIEAYLEAIWIGRGVPGMDMSETFHWVEKPLEKFIDAMRGDIEQLFRLLEGLAERKHDVDREGIELVLNYLARSPVPADKTLRDRLRGLCSRAVGKINRSMRPLSANPGFKYTVESLEAVVKQVEAVQV
jgi:tetratricopeptide (TPR) repeat protein